MHPALSKNVYLVKEHYGFFKAANNFDIYDPESKEVVLECREESLGIFTKLLRFTEYKRFTPFDLTIRTAAGEEILRVHRGISLFLSKVLVKDGDGSPIGGFKQKLFSIGGAFSVLDANDNPLCELRGKWTGWEFKFEHNGVEMARVTRKWGGIGAELFTDKDNYILQISDSAPMEGPMRGLIVAAVMCIDMVLKEN